ncbi:hypothetical protein EV363DRAFT_554367 [Boletus edulis]|nr:hypothetical protein EV363DRAFT_554367 [Boletus edulis]
MSMKRSLNKYAFYVTCKPKEIPVHSFLASQPRFWQPYSSAPLAIIITPTLAYPTQTAPDWVNVSYVCRHWRNVALNCATLWSYLFITSRRWTEELLARSKQVSLKLHAEVYLSHRGADDRWLCFVRRVMNHIERIQELHLNLPHICDHFLSSPCSSPAKPKDHGRVSERAQFSAVLSTLRRKHTSPPYPRAFMLSSAMAFIHAEWFDHSQSPLCSYSSSAKHGGVLGYVKLRAKSEASIP